MNRKEQKKNKQELKWVAVVINAVSGVVVVRVGVHTIEETQMVTTHELTSTYLMLKNIRFKTEKVTDVAVEVYVGKGNPTQLIDSQILFLETTIYRTQECLHMTL